jgi:uncharacterized OsmC-like protein
MPESASEKSLGEAIRSITEPPERARVRFRASTELGPEGLRCEGVGRKHTVVVDEPVSIGGSDQGQNPVELTLTALATCQAITYRLWATLLGVAVDRIAVEATGIMDTRCLFGVDHDVHAGIEEIEVTVTLEGPESRARYEELADAVDPHCPLTDMLARPLTITRTLVT